LVPFRIRLLRLSQSVAPLNENIFGEGGGKQPRFIKPATTADFHLRSPVASFTNLNALAVVRPACSVIPMHSLPILGFDRPDDACTDAAPLVVRWADGRMVGGILAPLDPLWLRAFQVDQERNEELRSRGITVLADHLRRN
jgi:hypothetical protein